MNNALQDQAAGISDRIRDWRRHLHAHPELSGEEENTARFVAERLCEMGYQPVEGVGETFGLTATLDVNSDAPLVALRADMDALPIHEQTGLEFASKNPGAMHACGHDAHTAMLLGAAQLLMNNKADLPRSVRLIFQPHEESYPGGANPMIQAGGLENVDSIFGIHISSQIPSGSLGTRSGPFMAAVNDIRIIVTGKGGHAAMPEQCVDPIVAAAQIIVALQSVVSRSIAMTDTAVVSITRVQGGSADNVIPDQVRMTGTIRTFDETIRTQVGRRVGQIAERVAEAHGATAEVRIEPGYPVLANDERATACALEAARAVGFGDGQVQTLTPIGGGEDFAYYCQKVPGCFAFLGARNPDKQCVYPHHHARFNIDEDVLPSGSALLAQYAANPLQTG